MLKRSTLIFLFGKRKNVMTYEYLCAVALLFSEMSTLNIALLLYRLRDGGMDTFFFNCSFFVVYVLLLRRAL